jgi:hypothetical protein
MSDLSELQNNPLMPALILSLMFSQGEQFSEKAGLYLRNIVRLIDKSINEYQEAREAIIAQVKEPSRPVEQMKKEGRILYLLFFVDHSENCINAIRRLFYLLDALKGEGRSPMIPKNSRNFVESNRKLIREIRNTVEHLDKRIQKDELHKGKPIMLSLSDDEKGMIIHNSLLKFSDLEHVIRNFYTIGKHLVKSYRK